MVYVGTTRIDSVTGTIRYYGLGQALMAVYAEGRARAARARTGAVHTIRMLDRRPLLEYIALSIARESTRWADTD